MKKVLIILLAVFLLCGCLSACGSGSSQPDSDTGAFRIVTTIFPIYDWAMRILGDNPAKADVTMLLDKGVDLHSFQPTAADILKISTCDIFVYVGGESDEWVVDALQEAVNKDMIVINLLDVLGDSVKEEEVIEGMQEEEHDHEHEDDNDEEHEEEEVEYDEHVWLSLKNAAVFVESITEAVQKKEPEHADSYRKNADIYIEALNALDAEYETAVSEASTATVLFGDRFPFRYLVDDYGLSYFAAFVGCSAETEASFETVSFLSRKVDELALPAVITIEGSDHRIAETIVQNTQTKDQRILVMDSMQATTAEDAGNGTTYLSVMEKNLSVLKDALR